MADTGSLIKRIIHFGLVLACICAVAAIALGYVFRAAQPEIDKNEALQVTQGLQELFSDSENVSFTTKTASINENEITYNEAYSDETLIGYAVAGSAQGYSSTVKVLVRVSLDLNTVEKLKVTSSAETPGLGERIKEINSTNTLVGYATGKTKDESHLRPWFQELFNGLPKEKLIIAKTPEEGIVAISGATVSSKAVTDAAAQAVQSLQSVLKEK